MWPRLKTVLLAVLIALLWSSPANAGVRCSMRSAAQSSGCCHSKGRHPRKVIDLRKGIRSEPPGPQFRRKACCTMELGRAVASAAVLVRVDDGLELGAASMPCERARVQAVHRALDLTLGATRARGPPRPSARPLYLLRRAFLL